jgi:hypothetical protein
MFMVSKNGVRVVNEKRNYNDRTEAHLTYDPNNAEFPNQLLFIIYDQRTAELYAGAHPLPATPSGAPYVIEGASLDELASNIGARLERIRAHIGSVRLSADFALKLQQSFDRFNGYAKKRPSTTAPGRCSASRRTRARVGRSRATCPIRRCTRSSPRGRITR